MFLSLKAGAILNTVTMAYGDVLLKHSRPFRHSGGLVDFEQ
jgi:hypothetical protein